MYGGDEARALHRKFTSRHPRFKVTAFKRWGVALLRLPDTFDEYLAGCARIVPRRRQHALKAGFRYAAVSPSDYLDQILEINQSTPTRQGRAMASHYLDRAQETKFFEGRTSIHGIVDSGGRLRAYALVLDMGEALSFSRIIGHADYLGERIMYLLVSEVIRSCIDIRRGHEPPTWLMLDTLWGASKGLAYFKELLGFRPHTVTLGVGRPCVRWLLPPRALD
jgi:hypothetical protein